MLRISAAISPEVRIDDKSALQRLTSMVWQGKMEIEALGLLCLAGRIPKGTACFGICHSISATNSCQKHGKESAIGV